MKPAIVTTPAAEEWRQVKGYEGLYEVSNLGRVRSLDRYQERVCPGKRPFFQHYKGKIMKQSKNNMGYFTIQLQIHKKVGRFLVSRLVAESFVPNPNKLPIVNHKDQNPANNIADNLEWCTIRYNIMYKDAAIKRGMATGKRIEQRDMNNIFVATFYSASAAARETGLTPHSACIRRAARLHQPYKGFIWKYV